MNPRPTLEPAFVAFYREHFEFAWRTLARLGVEPSECADAAQEVFTTVYRRWPTAIEAASPRGWVFGVVRRIAARYRRTRQRYLRRLQGFARIASAPRGLEDQLRRREAWTRLHKFLDELDVGSREAFVLGDLEGLGRKELGLALGLNPNTAYSRLQAARRRFVLHFADCSDEACARMLAAAAVESEPGVPTRERSLLALVYGLQSGRIWPSTAALGNLAGWGWIGAAALAAWTAFSPGTGSRPVAGEQPVVSPSAPVARAADGAEPDALTAGPPLDPGARLAPEADDTDSTKSHVSLRGGEARNPEPVVAAARRSAPTRLTSLREAGSATPAPRGKSKPRAESEPPTRGTPRESSPNMVDEELRLLFAARQSWVQGDRAAARRYLDQHWERFGESGELSELRTKIVKELKSNVIIPDKSGDEVTVEDQTP